VINFSFYIIPLFIFFLFIYAYLKKIKIYEIFIEGAGEGVKVIIEILPYLMAMILAVNLFENSGLINYFLNHFNELFIMFDIPKEVTPLLFLRPLSGSASLAYINNIFQNFGVDSFLGKLASTIQGSTETTFYILTVYFGAIGIKKFRYSIIVALIADIAGFIAAIFICNILFK